MKFTIFVIFCGLNGPGFAQGTTQSVFPPGFENAAGESADAVFAGSLEFQQIFRASALAGVWTSPVRITEIAFRLNENSSSFNASYPRLEIRLSTTTRAPEAMTTLWSLNSGPDAATVYLHNNVTLMAAGGKPINPFELQFDLDTPFDYDPSKGHLAMYIKPTPSGEGGTRTIDAQSYPDSNTAPVAAITSNFVGPAPYGLITEFTWVPIPEPSAFVLILCGGTLALKLTRKERI